MKINQLKKQIIRARQSMQEAKAELKVVQRQLSSEFSVNSLDEATELVDSLKSKIADRKKELAKQVAVFTDKWGDVLES